jgi:hypothetical protein
VRRTILCLIFCAAIENALSGIGRPFDSWESPSMDALAYVGFRPPTAEPAWEFDDPTFLYVCFEDIPFAGGIMTTWLHPTRNRSHVYIEPFKPGHEESARAFGYQITRKSADGYEVSFQPIDPRTGQPLPLKDTVIFFPRSHTTCKALSNRSMITGFYGNPRQPRPGWFLFVPQRFEKIR